MTLRTSGPRWSEACTHRIDSVVDHARTSTTLWGVQPENSSFETGGTDSPPPVQPCCCRREPECHPSCAHPSSSTSDCNPMLKLQHMSPTPKRLRCHRADCTEHVTPNVSPACLLHWALPWTTLDRTGPWFDRYTRSSTSWSVHTRKKIPIQSQLLHPVAGLASAARGPWLCGNKHANALQPYQVISSRTCWHATHLPRLYRQQVRANDPLYDRASGLEFANVDCTLRGGSRSGFPSK